MIIIDGLDLKDAGINAPITLPGIDTMLAGRIVDDREARDGFESFDDLGDASGVTRALLENLRTLLGN